MAHDFSACTALALPTDFLRLHVFLFVGTRETDRFLHTYLPAVVFDGEWRQVGHVGEWKQGNVDFSCDSDRPPATVQGIVRDGGRPFPRLCWEILFQRQQSQKMAWRVKCVVSQSSNWGAVVVLRI